MRWLVVGASGMLGQDLLAELLARGESAVGIDRAEVDITDPDSAMAAVTGGGPAGAGYDVVVNCAAWTAVDDAESNEGPAFTVNAVGPANLAVAARTAGARLVQISTDYVFDGSSSAPYPEDAPIAPRSAYGRTKAAGEWAVRAEAPDHLILRTAWLYGAHGRCFPKTMARLAAERGALTVIDDQQGQPTWTMDVADLVIRLTLSRAPSGTYHATSSGRCSWFDFARAVVSSAGHDPAIVAPTTSEAFASPAPRPAFSVLGHDALPRIGQAPIGDWRERWELAAASVLG